MSVAFKTNADILNNQIANLVNSICALRHQLTDLTDDGVRHSIETTIIKMTSRLDTMLDTQASWDLPKKDNQDVATQQFEQGIRMTEYALWTQEVHKQVALGNLTYKPSYVAEPVAAEIVEPPKPPQKKRKKK